MYVPFEQMPGSARIWIYQADREFTEAEEKVIHEASTSFCQQWVAHGDPLKTSFKTDSRLFLLLGVDEEMNLPSGCSIDSSVKMIRYLKDQLAIDFLDRSRTAFWINNAVKLIPRAQLKQAVTDGILGPDTETFHILASTKDEWENRRLLPAGKTWVARYFPKAPAT